MGIQIAIDGPGGSGKSTVAKNLARYLGFVYVDTGAMYRACGYYFLRQNIDLGDIQRIEAALPQIHLDIRYQEGVQHIFLNGEDVTEDIRVQAVADASSKVAVIEKVRLYLVELQRAIAQANDVIMDGRDIASHVLPNAQVKIYLDASIHVRAERRRLELSEKGIEAPIEQIEKEIQERDDRDMSRKISPLVRVPEATVIDSSHCTQDEVMVQILSILSKRGVKDVL